MINDLYPWPPTYAPTLGQPVPIAGAAPPAPPQRDLVGDLRRTQAQGRAPKAPRRTLTDTEDAALRAAIRLPTLAARAAAYRALAAQGGVAVASVELRAWWLRTEAGL